MNQKFLLGGVVAALLTITAMSASADDGDSRSMGESAGPGGRVVVIGDSKSYLLGEPAGSGGRVVVIGDSTSYVNVTNGEAVKFVIGDKTFSWAFDGPSTINEIDLNKLTPPGTLGHLVKVYVERAPGDGA